MILTGPEIRAQIAIGKYLHGKEEDVFDFRPGYGSGNNTRKVLHDKMSYIDIDPYDESLVGPNSIDLRLGEELIIYGKHSDFQGVNIRSSGGVNWHPPGMDGPLDMRGENPTIDMKIPEDGIVLLPGTLYLARTIETIGSNSFVPIVEGRSSVGRLGIHVHVTAGFCDLGFRGTITLEIHVIHPVRIYPNVPICQAYFLRPEGEIELYKGRYQNQVKPTASRFGVKVESEDE